MKKLVILVFSMQGTGVFVQSLVLTLLLFLVCPLHNQNNDQNDNNGDNGRYYGYVAYNPISLIYM